MQILRQAWPTSILGQPVFCNLCSCLCLSNGHSVLRVLGTDFKPLQPDWTFSPIDVGLSTGSTALTLLRCVAAVLS